MKMGLYSFGGYDKIVWKLTMTIVMAEGVKCSYEKGYTSKL